MENSETIGEATQKGLIGTWQLRLTGDAIRWNTPIAKREIPLSAVSAVAIGIVKPQTQHFEVDIDEGLEIAAAP